MDLYYLWRPWEAAVEVFDRQDRDQLYYVGMLRAVVGLAGTAGLSIPYRGPLDVLLDAASKAALTGVVALGLLVVVVPVAYLLADPAGRDYMHAGLPDLARSTGCGVLVIAFFAAVSTSPGWLEGLPPLVGVAVGLGGLWLLLFGLVGLVLAARTMFGVADVHPLFAPVVAAAVGTAIFAGELVEMDTDGLPLDLYLRIGWAGYVAATGLAVWEFVLAYRAGHRIVGGPRPASRR